MKVESLGNVVVVIVEKFEEVEGRLFILPLRN